MLLSLTQNQQSMADFRAIAARGLVNGAQLCDPENTESAYRHHLGDSTHFRSPSPHGRLVSFDAMPPDFFPPKSLIWQYFADQLVPHKRALHNGLNLSFVSVTNEAEDTQ